MAPGTSTHADHLLANARGGDARALNLLLRREAATVRRLCARLCGAPLDPEEVFQETLLAIARHIGAYRGDAAFSTWVYTLARTQRGRALRRLASSGRAREAAELRAGDSLPLADPDRADLRDALYAATRDLSDVDREILLLRDLEGLTAAEVSHRIGLTIPAVKTRLHRARTAVRGRL